MSKIDTGGPAFPYRAYSGIPEPGMTLRDYLAAKAITAFIFAGSDYERAALEAYKQADAMLSARSTKKARDA